MERKMKSKITILLLMSAFAIPATNAVAQPRHHRHPARVIDHAAAFDQAEWYQKWMLNRLYNQPEGYVPDYRGCFPGACRDNPRY
jgi:hypothetical protein